MGIDILKLLQDANNEYLAFEKHPASKLDLDQKVHYLNALALLMNSDEEIHEKERGYLVTLIHSFNLPNEKLDELIAFSKSADNSSVIEMNKMLPKDELKFIFLMDCFIIAYKDGVLKPVEKNVIGEYARTSKINKIDIDRVERLYKVIIERRPLPKNETISFQGCKVDIKIFNYLFDYYGVKHK